MGTRGLICIWKDGQFKLANYNQFDSYPSGQGASVLQFLSEVDLDKFSGFVSNLGWADDEAVQEAWKSVGATGGWANMTQSKEFKNKYPEFHRSTGSNILSLIMEREGKLNVADSSSFATDGLFCEWAYVVDLDALEFVVYTCHGDGEKGDEGHFSNVEKEVNDHGYPTVTECATYSLVDLPTYHEFVEDLEPSEEDDD